MISLLPGVLLIANYCTGSITNFLTSGPNVWFPIILLAALAIITIVGLIYALSPLMGRTDIRTWARAKIYDALVTIIFAIIFLSFSTAICTVSPVSSMRSMGILPTTCDPNVANTPSSAGISDIYGLSLCEMYQFNLNAASFTQSLYWMSIVLGINPTLSVFLPPEPYPFMPSPAGPGIGVSFSIALFPIVLVHQYVIPYIQAYFAAILASELLQIVLSASMLLLSVFLILGLLARSFSITKSFGGAMIAFGIGLGFVFPLMAMLTYGFIDTAMLNAQATACGSLPLHGNACTLPSLASIIIPGILALPINWIFGNAISFNQILTPFIVYGGFVSAGLILIPLLNLIVVDAFIVDFSKAIGERMDLFSLMTRIL